MTSAQSTTVRTETALHGGIIAATVAVVLTAYATVGRLYGVAEYLFDWNGSALHSVLSFPVGGIEPAMGTDPSATLEFLTKAVDLMQHVLLGAVMLAAAWAIRAALVRFRDRTTTEVAMEPAAATSWSEPLKWSWIAMAVLAVVSLLRGILLTALMMTPAMSIDPPTWLIANIPWMYVVLSLGLYAIHKLCEASEARNTHL